MLSKLFGQARNTRKQRRDSSRREHRQRVFPRLEHLERREMLDGTAYLSGGVLHIDCTGGPDTVVLDHVGASAAVVIDRGVLMTFADNLYGSIQISGGTNGLDTTILRNVRPLTLLGHHDMDRVDVGYLGLPITQTIHARLDLENPLAYNNVVLHDEGIHSDSVDVLASTFGGWSYESVIFGGLTEIDCKVNDTRSVTVQTGAAKVNVLATASFFGGLGTAIVQWQGDDVVNVGSGRDGQGTLANINGPLTVGNFADYNLDLNIHDELDTLNRTATISGAAITGLSNGTINTYDFALDNLTVNGGTGNNTYNLTGSPCHASVTLNTGNGHDTTNLQANRVPTTIATTADDGGGGNDVVNLGTPAGSLSGIQAPVTIFNGPSRDSVNINGSADAGDHNVTFSDTGPSAGIAGLAPAEIYLNSYSVSTLSVRGGTGNNTYTVASTPAYTSVTLDTGSGIDTTNVQVTTAPLAVNTTTGAGGDGNDVVNIGSNNTLAFISRTVTILNSSSSDHININDQADAGDHPNAVITNAGAGGVTGLARAAINFTSSSCDRLVVNTGSGHNTVMIPSTPANELITVNTGTGGGAAVNVQGSSVPVVVNEAGSDTVTISNAAHTVDGIAGVAVSGNASSTVVVDDSSHSGDETYSITQNTVNAARLGASPLLTYGGLGRLVVLGGNAVTNDLFTIDSTSCPLDVHGGAGPNCFSISSFSNSLATITAALHITGSGADVISFWDQLNPAAETYNFDSVPSMLTLTTLPVEIDFSGMGGGVYLQTNGLSTVNDPSGSVIVDGLPPC
jgi:hypothetical protein